MFGGILTAFSALTSFLSKVVGPIMFWRAGRDAQAKDSYKKSAEDARDVREIEEDVAAASDAELDRMLD